MASRILGIDFGLRRVGFAVSDELHVLATPLEVYKTKSMRQTIDRTAELCKKYSVGLVVIGLPLSMNGEGSPASARVKAFASVVERVTGLPVALKDERLSTVEGYELLAEVGYKKNAADVIDSVSAELILQSYLDSDNK